MVKTKNAQSKSKLKDKNTKSGKNKKDTQNTIKSQKGHEKAPKSKILSEKKKTRNEDSKKVSVSSLVDSINKKHDEKVQTSQKIKNFFKTKLIRSKELFLGKTKKQKDKDKPHYIGKKILVLFFMFIISSLVVFLHMNISYTSDTLIGTIMNAVVLNNPYAFGIGISITFVIFSAFFTNNKILVWFFENHYAIKQISIFTGLTYLNQIFAFYLLQEGVDFYALLLLFATFWMILQCIRLYSGSRKFATKLESKWTNRYSSIRYFFAIILPYVGLGVLVTIMWAVRYYIVIFTLDLLGPHVPEQAFEIYDIQMSIVMPMGYISLVLIFIFIVINGILTRKMGDTKRAGAFDNLAYAIISFVMFLFVIYNILLYLFLNETMIDAINDAMGSTGNSRSFFIAEYLITILFLIWIVIELGNEFKTGFLFFTNNGFVMFMLGAIMAQSTSRLGIITGEAGKVSPLARFLALDYIMIPIFIIIFLGLTILIYYIRPQKTSIFLRVNEAAVNKEDRSMITILKFLKREFIRRGEKYLIDDNLIHQIRTIIDLPKGVVWSLIHRLDDAYMDVQLLTSKDENGNKQVFLDFIPITEKYQKDKKATAKAEKYMRDRFSNLIAEDQRKKIKLYSGKKSSLSSSKQSDLFIQALGVQYGRKIKDEESRRQSEEQQQLIIDRAIDRDTKDLILELIRQEYINRIKQVSDYPDFRFRISEIANKVEIATKVSPGRLYPLLDQMAAENWNFNVNANIEEGAIGDDKIIEFLPIDDFEIYYAIEEYRPNKKREIAALMQTWFERNVNFKKIRMDHLPPKEYKDGEAELQRSYRSKWFSETIWYFAKNYKERQPINLPFLKGDILQKAMTQIIEGKLRDFEKKIKEASKKQKQLPNYSYKA